MSDYTKYYDKALTKIAQYGSPISVKRSGKKIYDKKTNTYIDDGEEFAGYAIQRDFDQRNIDGTNVKFGDVLFMASLEKRPQSNDSVTFEGKKYTVINVVPLSPNGKTDIFYNIQAR